YMMPIITGREKQRYSSLGMWAFWLQVIGMFGMTLSFAVAGITQVYLERIMGLGYLETQYKIQVHFLMLLGAGSIFALGVGMFIWDFFRFPPLPGPALEAVAEGEPKAEADAEPQAKAAEG